MFYLTCDVSIEISRYVKFKCAIYKLFAALQPKALAHLTYRSKRRSFAEASFFLKPLHVGFVADNVTFGRVLLRTHPLSCGRAIPSVLHTDLSPQPTL